MLDKLRKLVEDFDWKVELADPEVFKEYLAFDPEFPDEASKDHAGVFAYFSSLYAMAKTAADEAERELASYLSTYKETKKLLEQRLEAELSTVLSDCYDRAAERLTKEAEEKGLRFPTADRIRSAALGDPEYKHALAHIDEQRKALVEDRSFSQRVKDLRYEELYFEGLLKALTHRSTATRVAGDLVIARMRSGT